MQEELEAARPVGYGVEHSETSGVTPLSLISTFGKIRRGALSSARVECELDLRLTHPLQVLLPMKGKIYQL